MISDSDSDAGVARGAAGRAAGGTLRAAAACGPGFWATGSVKVGVRATEPAATVTAGLRRGRGGLGVRRGRGRRRAGRPGPPGRASRTRTTNLKAASG